MSPGKTNSVDVAQDQASAALESYLNSGVDLQDAVSLFIQPVFGLYDQKLPSESQLSDSLDALWTALLDIAQSIPYSDPTQDRLISFIKGVKSLPPPDRPAPEIWGLSLWHDLPILSASMRERWNISSNAGTDHWANLNAFAARLTASHVLDPSLYAIWAMRDALETPIENIKPETRDQAMRAAALWIFFCGGNLEGLKRIWEADPRKGDVARGGPLYGGPKGFCVERWSLWRERFGILCGESRLDEETRKMLGDAKKSMDVS